MDPVVVPDSIDAARCIELRCQSKRGVRLHPDDQAFCERMFREFPDWYGKTEPRIFDLTVPFGSTARRDET